MESCVDVGDGCDVPVGKDETGGPVYGFCIGNGSTEKNCRTSRRKVVKTEDQLTTSA